MASSNASQSERSKRKSFEISKEFKIEFLRREVKIKVKDESLERLSLSKIIAAAKKIQSHEVLQKIAEYYVENKWLFAAGNIYELIGDLKALQKAEKCYAEGGYYLSAIKVCKTIGTPDALKRAQDYSCIIC